MKNLTPSVIRDIQKAATLATLAVTPYYVTGWVCSCQTDCDCVVFFDMFLE